jgi:hypothetical protein
MADGLRINAAEYVRFAALVKTFDRKVRNGIRKRIRESARAFGPEIVQEGAEPLPDRGGVEAAVVAKGRAPTVAQTSTGVRLVLGKKKGPQIGRMNEGNLRHPVFGRRKAWVDQPVPAGSWTAAAEARLPKLRDAVRAEMESILKEFG